jgi:Ca-activated chloride channel homolog
MLVEPPIHKKESARELLLAVDISGSMGTPDFTDPQGRRIERLDALKLVLRDFVARRNGDRIGLLVFGDAPYPRSPDALGALNPRMRA